MEHWHVSGALLRALGILFHLILPAESDRTKRLNDNMKYCACPFSSSLQKEGIVRGTGSDLPTGRAVLHL